MLVMDKNVLRNLSYGVYVVTSTYNKKNAGCIANSIMQITSNPVTIAISMNHDNHTNKIISCSNFFAISILKETTNPKIIGEFGFKTSKDTNKFKDVKHKLIEKIPVINDSCGYIICKVIDKIQTSSHTIFIGEAIKADNFTSDNPMTYKYYHEKLKGSSSKNAPTYQKEEQIDNKNGNKMKKWKCKICGYVYEGDELPKNFICPICGQPHTEFYEITN